MTDPIPPPDPISPPGPILTPGATTGEPEQVLADYPLVIDEDTLREVVQEPAPLQQVHAGLTHKLASAKGDAARARLLGLRAVVSRLLGQLKEALEDAEPALRHAQATGSARRIAVASTRLARVHQWRGEYDVADELYQRALDAGIPDRLRAAIHHHFGTSCYDQGRFLEAIHHFETVLALQPGQDADKLAATGRAFTAISRRATLKGFGPFPRTRAEILQESAPPLLRFHEVFRRYGYADADGHGVIPPAYHQAYQFSDGVAWVQPDTTERWSAIDTTGEVLISGTDFQSVGPYSEGLAWVVSDPVVGWYAIDRHGITMVPPAGYTDARPFHAGLAAVCRNGLWGAVDRDGREVVPMEYTAFRTASSDAVYLGGFSSEGLAVVERKGRLGVINRDADPVVPLVFQQIEIHPVGFLVMPPPKNPDYTDPFRSTQDLADGWGAMDRGGELVVETVHPNRAEVLEQLEKLLRDTQPIL
ncbi:MAG: WG repeat-containing protein [Micromonosporaceae bacterium]